MRPPDRKKLVAVVTPIYRLPLSADEEISLKQLQNFLGKYDLYLAAPKSLKVADEALQRMHTERFPDRFFSGIEGYNRLMLSRGFYDRFRDYEYVLIYQLDCLVFSEDLEQWCRKGWDYVGAPWFKDCKDDTSAGFWAVGNGGLSLRRVSKFLEVLRSRKRLHVPSLDGETRFFRNSPRLQRLFCRLKAFAYASGYKNNITYFIRQYEGYEDLFWAFLAKRFVSSFVIPPPNDALPFAFESAPRFCFEANGMQLPFGCHAWYKIDSDFWRSVLRRSKDRDPREASNFGA